MKRYYSLCFVAIIIYLLFFAFFILILTQDVIVFADSDGNDCIISVQDKDSNYDSKKETIRIINDNHYCVEQDVVSILFESNKEDEIIDIEINGDYDCKHELLSNNSFKILFRRSLENCYKLIEVDVLCSIRKYTFSLYSVETEQGIFFSQESARAAEQEWLNYIANNKLISNYEKEAIADALNQGYGIFSLSELFYETKQNNRGAKDTYASGSLRWLDDNNVSHPLRFVRVELYDANSSLWGDTLLATTFSTGGGNYSFTFQNNDSFIDNYGSDIYIKVYAGDDNARVSDIYCFEYCYVDTGEGHFFENVSTGGTYNFSLIEINMSDTVGQAMQISQAIFAARAYAESMTGVTPHWVEIEYPTNEASIYYSHSEYTIYLQYIVANNAGVNSYAAWDMIMHEYGHHIQYELGITQSPGGRHWLEFNMIDRKQEENGNPLTKSQAIKLSYAEAWATAFAMIAQHDYQYTISNVATVCDGNYTDYSRVFYVETSNYRYGEGCEGTILPILWDLYDDSPNESNDSISLSASDWWNITTISGTYTFSDLVQNFYSEYPEYESVLGANLSYYKMSASNLNIGVEDDLSDPPSISWSNYSGWDDHPFTTIAIAMDEDEDSTLLLGIANDDYVAGRLSQSQWDTILSWSGATFKVKLVSAQGDDPETGPYNSQIYIIEKPQFMVSLVNNSYEITGTYCPINGSLVIPSDDYFGKTITGISSGAFSGQVNITYVYVPDSVTSVGSYAFNNCTSLNTVSISSTSQITRIENYTFYNCPISTLYWQNYNIEYIGDYAFYGSSLQRIILTNNTTYVGTYAFGNNNNLTIYCESDGAGWHPSWNPSNRPFIGYCFLSSNYSYVESFIKSGTNPGTAYSGTINNPIRSDYTFDGWYTTSNYSGTRYSTIDSAPNGMLYVKWYKPSSSGSCITTGSLITLADGTQTTVENLTGNEQLLVWDMLNGTFSSVPILFIDRDPTMTYEVITLTFSDNTQVEVIDEHAFFDTTLNKYVFLRNDAAQYIGHSFIKQTLDENNNMIQLNVQLINVTISSQVTTAYSPVTYGHLCYYVNGMLSMPGNTESFINIFDVNPTTMAYDGTGMAQDIATYGLYTYEEFNNIIPIPQLVFDAFNGQYLKVAIGKGITTLEEIQNLLNRYMSFFE